MVKYTVLAAAAALTLSAQSQAAPAPSYNSPAVPAFTREASFNTYGTAGAQLPEGFGDLDDSELALAFLLEKTPGLTRNDLLVTDEYVTGNIRKIYIQRSINGVRLSNQVANIAIRDGKIISFGSSIVSPANSLTEPVIDPPKVTVDAAQAVANAERVLGLKKNDIEPYLRYTETAEAKYKYVWCFQVRNEVEDPNFQWFEVDVAADSGEIAATYSWVAHAAQYSAVDFRSKDPNPDDHLITHGDLSLKNASPNGWHDNNKQTSGNNVISFRKQGSERLLVKGKGAEGDQYVAPYDRTQSPKTPEHQDLAVINNFVTVNRIHDLLYQYGFTEDAGNFQIDNFGKGGKGGDAVTVSAQDPAGVNNADFTTPPDGQAGVMRMYIFTSTNPNRDASLSNDVTIHEYVHGLSNRLTGGPANSNCLQTLQSRGMGEGWGDTVAIFVQRDATQTRNDDATVGSWVTNNRNGIRAKPYSTDFSRNDLKYANIASMTSVHQVGTVWATMWNEVFWNLVDQAGLAEDIFNAQQEKGNVIALQLLVDGLALQPCNPTFVQARDAVLQAEQTRYGGKYKCAIIKGFAKRGLGMRATSTPANDETVPPECEGPVTPNPEPTTTVAVPTAEPTTVAPTVEPTTTVAEETTTVAPTVEPTTTVAEETTTVAPTVEPTTTTVAEETTVVVPTTEVEQTTAAPAPTTELVPGTTQVEQTTAVATTLAVPEPQSTSADVPATTVAAPETTTAPDAPKTTAAEEPCTTETVVVPSASTDVPSVPGTTDAPSVPAPTTVAGEEPCTTETVAAPSASTDVPSVPGTTDAPSVPAPTTVAGEEPCTTDIEVVPVPTTVAGEEPCTTDIEVVPAPSNTATVGAPEVTVPAYKVPGPASPAPSSVPAAVPTKVPGPAYPAPPQPTQGTPYQPPAGSIPPVSGSVPPADGSVPADGSIPPVGGPSQEEPNKPVVGDNGEAEVPIFSSAHRSVGVPSVVRLAFGVWKLVF